MWLWAIPKCRTVALYASIHMLPEPSPSFETMEEHRVVRALQPPCKPMVQTVLVDRLDSGDQALGTGAFIRRIERRRMHVREPNMAHCLFGS